VKYSILCFFLAFIHILTGYSQDKATEKGAHVDKGIIIDQVIFVGNKKTKNYIINRELSFNQGDTIGLADTNKVFSRCRDNVFNTGLFIYVKSEMYTTDSLHYVFVLKVKERWYFWPIPIMELADRNFNEWVQEQAADLSRINFGIDFRQKNFRGRNEVLHIKLQTGFTKKYEFFYDFPYIDKKRKIGLKVFTSYSTNKIVAFQTVANKLQYYEGENIARRRFYGGFSVIWRAILYSKHEFSIRYKDNYISDIIRELNSNYFLDDRNDQQYFQLRYRFKHDKRDVKYYSLSGHFTELEINKSGIGIFEDINQLDLYIGHSRYWSINKSFFISSMMKGKFSVPKRPPYANNRGMGYYEDFVRGNELYVVDGQKYVLNRNEFKLKIFNKTSQLDNYVGNNQFSTIPLQVYIKAYADLGWVNDHIYGYLNPLLNDRLLSGVGLGLDFVTFYDAVFRVEYSYNQLGEHGLFLHVGTAI